MTHGKQLGDALLARVLELEAEAKRLRAELASERGRWHARIEQAFREGYWARETYNDSEVSDADAKWASAKAGLLRA